MPNTNVRVKIIVLLTLFIVLLSNGDGGSVEVATLSISTVWDAEDLMCSSWITIPQVHNEGTLRACVHDSNLMKIPRIKEIILYILAWLN